MSLKTVATLCAIALLAQAIWGIGQNGYYLATTDYYDVYDVMRNIPYWITDVLLAIFFYLFSSRM